MGNSIQKRFESFYELSDPANPRRNLPMEGLRGLAVILVFFVHYHGAFSQWLDADSRTFAYSFFTWSIGHSGVDLFFVLSGYLIYGAVISKRTRYSSFIKRRIERIYPTFLCVLAIYLILSALFPEESKVPGRPFEAGVYILANVLLLPGIFDIQPIITVAWTLSYEFFYYLLIPLVVVVLGMQRWQRFHRVIFFTTFAALYLPYCLVGPFAHPRMIMFVSGILLYEARHSYNFGEQLKPRADYLVLILLALTFPAIYLLQDAQQFLPTSLSPGDFGEMFRVALLFVVFLLFTHACFGSRGLLKNIFSWRPLRWLGNMSYSYYLIHALTIKGIEFVLVRAFPPVDKSLTLFWVSLPVTFFLTLVSSTLLFLLVEKRFSLAKPASKTAAAVPILQSIAVPPEQS